jgi:hypothetical protein
VVKVVDLLLDVVLLLIAFHTAAGRIASEIFSIYIFFCVGFKSR